MKYDLHCHSTASDGELAPAEVVRRAHEMGVDVLALTDHDVLEGIPEASRAAARLGLVLVPGVEISVAGEGRLIHIVGLGIDITAPALTAGLEDLRDRRHQRAREIARRLERQGIHGAYEGTLALARGAVVSRSHFARYLVAQGHGRDVRATFKHYLGRGKSAYVPCQWATLEQALGWIRDAGGQAVVAHPARYQMGRRLFEAFLKDFVAAGGCAIEVVSSSHNPKECRAMADWAQRFGLYASAGSDFHGAAAGWAELGRIPPLPKGCLPIWRDWRLDKAAGEA